MHQQQKEIFLHLFITSPNSLLLPDIHAEIVKPHNCCPKFSESAMPKKWSLSPWLQSSHVSVIADPFRGGDHILVLCDTYCPASNLGMGSVEMKPYHTNNRNPCEVVMKQASHSEPLFTVEQQYTLLDPATSVPIGESP